MSCNVIVDLDLIYKPINQSGTELCKILTNRTSRNQHYGKLNHFYCRKLAMFRHGNLKKFHGWRYAKINSFPEKLKTILLPFYCSCFIFILSIYSGMQYCCDTTCYTMIYYISSPKSTIVSASTIYKSSIYAWPFQLSMQGN